MNALPKGSFNSFNASTSPTIPSVSPSTKLIRSTSPKPLKESTAQLPDLQHIIKPKRLQDEALAKNQYILQLQNHHSILRSIISVDREEGSLRDDTSLNRSFNRISAGIKLVGKGSEDKQREIKRFSENLLPIAEKNIRKKCRNFSLALEDVLSDSTSRWVSKKGITVAGKLSKGFISFLRELFDTLDEDHSGFLTVDEFIIPLLCYGITIDAKYIEKALLMMFNVKSLTSLKIEKEAFVKFFKEDSKTDTLLSSLQQHTQYMLDKEEDLRLARRRSLGNALHLETRIEDVVPKIYCTIEEYIKMIKVWWKELLEENNLHQKSPFDNKIHQYQLTDFLVEKKLVSNNIEAIRLSNAMQQAGCVFYDSFEKIFLKALLKSGLLNLAFGLDNGDFAGRNTSLLMKLARCQRKFMVSGVSLRNSELALQGRKALQAVSKYQQEHSDTSRAKATINAQEYLANNAEYGGDRHKNYLYKINENAKEFVDQVGNVATSLKDPWDIRDQVNLHGKKIDNSIDHEDTFNKELYFSMLSPAKLNKRAVEPFPRNVKAFRENFLFDKFKTASIRNEKYRNFNNQSI